MNTPRTRTAYWPALLSAGIWLACTGAQAQGVYRVVTPDGKVVFTDQPPAQGQAAPVTSGPAVGAASETAGLPPGLRNAMSRFPVTLYTATGCGPCDGGRALLQARGVPHTEKTVNRNEDVEALQKLSGGNSLPYLTIGQQGLKGFTQAEWTQYLDAAGYPRQSALPRNYKPSTPSPLVPVTAGQTTGGAAAQGQNPAPASRGAAGSTPPADPPSVPVTPPTNPTNPAGIRF